MFTGSCVFLRARAGLMKMVFSSLYLILYNTLIRPPLLAHDSTRNVHLVTVRLFIENHNRIGDCNTVGCFNKRLSTAGGPLTIHTNICLFDICISLTYMFIGLLYEHVTTQVYFRFLVFLSVQWNPSISHTHYPK